MSVATQADGRRTPSPSGLAEVIDTILDKGLVLDAYVRVSLVGIELLTIDARVVLASVDTYLRFAEAVNRLDISQDKETLPELASDMHQGGDRHQATSAREAAGEKAGHMAGQHGQDGKRSARGGRPEKALR